MLSRARQLAMVFAAFACAGVYAQDALPESAWAPTKTDGALRIATFNVWDYGPKNTIGERDERLFEVIRALDADLILLNEVATPPGEESLVAERFAAQVGTKSGSPHYDAYSASVNTGVPSGFDLNNDGKVIAEPGSRGYGDDCFGYGEFPGQYGMMLLVRKSAGTIEREDVRTFREFLWKDMPGAMIPEDWYSGEELGVFRLSSKSHWDIPVRLNDGAVVHILASHPTPPTFDGPEDRNGRRNHDEIRLWADYISGGERASYIVDDHGVRGGLEPGALFVILGDMNASPSAGDGREGAIAQVLDHPRVQPNAPTATGARATMAITPNGAALRTPIQPTDTALFGLRADYVLPSVGFEVMRVGTVREESPEMATLADGFPAAPWWMRMFPSDHFPVFVDVRIPKKD